MKSILSTQIGQIVVLIAALLLSRHLIRMYLVRLLRRAVAANNRESVESQNKRVDTLVNIIGTLLTVGLIFIGVFGLLVILKVNIVGVLTGFSALGVIIGLGGQSAIKDILAGFFILIENQYRVGDVVTLGTVSGTVENITLRITRLRDFSGDLHIVPNGAVDIITNKTFGWSNVVLSIGVSYDADVVKVHKVIDEVGLELAKDEDWAMHIMEPIEFLRVDEFADSSVIIKALGRVEPGQQWAVAGEYRARLKVAFEKAGIDIPYPQRVIHSKNTTKKSTV